MSNRTISIRLKFLNDGMGEAAKAVGTISNNLTVMANAFKNLSAAQIRAIMGEITKSSKDGTEATDRLRDAVDKKAKADKAAAAKLEKLALAEEKLSAKRTKAQQIIKFAIERNERLKRASDELAKSKQRLAMRTILANRSMKRVNESSKKGNQAFKVATSVYKKVSQEVKKMVLAYDKLNTKSKKTSSIFSSIVPVFNAVSNGVTAVIQVLSSLYMWLTRIYNMADRVIRIFVDIIKEFGEFQQTVRSAAFILQTNMNSIGKVASSVTFLGISLGDAAQGLDEFGRAGYKASQAIKAFTPIAMFADAVNTNLGRATTMVTGAMKSFSFEAEDVWRITSGMTNAVYDSRNSFETLETAFSYAGAAGAAFNQSFEEVLVSTMAFRDLGLKASTSGTVYRRSLARLANATKPTRKAFEALNLDIRKFTVQTGRSFNDVINNFASLMDSAKITEKEFTGLMGKTIGPRFASYIKKLVDAVRVGKIDLDEMVTELQEKSSTLTNLTLFNITTLQQQIKIFTSLIDRAWKTFGGMLGKYLNPFLSAFNTFALNLIDRWDLTMDALQQSTEKGIEKMSKNDMKEIFKKWENSVVEALGDLSELIEAVAGPVEKLFLLYVETPLKILLNIMVPIAKIFFTVQGLVTGLITILRTLASVIITPFVALFNVFKEIALFLKSGVASLGKSFFEKLGIKTEFFDSFIDEDSITDRLNNISEKTKSTFSTEDIKKWGETSVASFKGVTLLDEALTKLNKSDLSGDIGDGLKEVQDIIKTTQKFVDEGGVIGSVSKIAKPGEERQAAEIAREREQKARERAALEAAEAEEDKQELLKKIREEYWDEQFKDSKEWEAELLKIKKDSEEDIAFAKETDRLLKEKKKWEDEQEKVLLDGIAKRDTARMKEWAKLVKDKKSAKEKAAKEEKKYNEFVISELYRIGLEEKKYEEARLKLKKDMLERGLLDLKSANEMTLNELRSFNEDVIQAEKVRTAGLEAYRTGAILTNTGFEQSNGIGLGENDREFLEQASASQQEYADILNEALMNQTNFGIQMQMSFEAMARGFGSVTEIMGTMTKSWANTVHSGLNNMVMAIFDKTKKIKDVFKDMGKAMLQALVSAFTKMLIQTIIFGKILSRTRGQQGMAQAKVDSANSAIAAYRSGWEAGHGWMGLALSEIFRGISITQTNMMMKGIQGYNTGTGLAGVPGIGLQDNTLAMLTPKEIVLNRAESDEYREEQLNRKSSGGDTYNITVYAEDSASFDEKWKNSFMRLNKGDAEVRRANKRSIRNQG